MKIHIRQSVDKFEQGQILEVGKDISSIGAFRLIQLQKARMIPETEEEPKKHKKVKDAD